MENNIQSNMLKHHHMSCDGRRNLSLTAIEKVESSNETQIICIINKSPLVISGKNLHVKKLDLEQGLVEIEGEIDALKYQAERKPFIKRLFK